MQGVSHVIYYTGLGLAVFLFCVARLWEGDWGWSPAILKYGLVCATLMNVSFAFIAPHPGAPCTGPELALVFWISPVVVAFCVGALLRGP